MLHCDKGFLKQQHKNSSQELQIVHLWRSAELKNLYMHTVKSKWQWLHLGNNLY